VLADDGREDVGLFFAGFMPGGLLWALFIWVLVGWAHRRTGPRFARSMNLLVAVGVPLYLTWHCFLTPPSTDGTT